MSVASSQYSVSRSTGVCAATGRAMQPGEPILAVLVEREGQVALERLDFSVEAWEGGARPQPPLRPVAKWRTTHHVSDQKARQLLSDDELLDLFDGLAEARDNKALAFRYFLALLLIRKRLLRCVEVRGQVMRVLPKGVPADQTPLEVRDPGLDDQMIADAMEQLARIIPSDDVETAKG
jgi:hypothetical protein